MTVQGALARGTAIFSDKLCRAIIKGVAAQLSADGIFKTGEAGIDAIDDDEAVNAAMKGPDQGSVGYTEKTLPNKSCATTLCGKHARKTLITSAVEGRG